MKSVLAIAAVLSLVAVATSCGGDSSEGTELIDKVKQAMARASFSHAITDCHLCPPPIVREYAPPDRIKLSDPKGHDDWPRYLIVGDQWLVSHRGIRWLSESVDHHHPSMLLNDPRVLLRIAADPELDGDDAVDRQANHVLRMGVDLDRFFTDILPTDVPEEMRGDEARKYYASYYGALMIRLWIDKHIYLVSQMEFDFPRVPADEEQGSTEDPQPYVIGFDYQTAVDVPERPEVMPYEEADRLRREADRRIEPLLEAIDLYRSLNGVYPSSLDPQTLKDVLPPAEWPVNPFSDEPMKQSEDSPGDFDYRVKNAGNDYEATFFGWDSAYLFKDTARSRPQG